MPSSSPDPRICERLEIDRPAGEEERTTYPGATDPAIRKRVEELLPVEVRAAMPALLAVYGIHEPNRWPHHPELAPLLTGVAIRVLQARHEHTGSSPTAALKHAAFKLRLNPETVRTQVARSRRRYLGAIEKSVSN